MSSSGLSFGQVYRWRHGRHQGPAHDLDRARALVAGYDNSFGLPPFFPTRLRFEDYLYRLWLQQDAVVAAHVDAAQHHTRSGYMRNPPAAEIFNEEPANLLKRRIKASVSRIDEHVRKTGDPSVLFPGGTS